jgi:hypothetical protein
MDMAAQERAAMAEHFACWTLGRDAGEVIAPLPVICRARHAGDREAKPTRFFCKGGFLWLTQQCNARRRT